MFLRPFSSLIRSSAGSSLPPPPTPTTYRGLATYLKTTLRKQFEKPERWSRYRKETRMIDVINRFRIVTGDLVQVIAGKDKGKQGKIMRVDRSHGQVIVEGCNKQWRVEGEDLHEAYENRFFKQRGKKPPRDEKKKMVMKHMPIRYHNVMLVDPQLKKPTRIGVRIEQDGTKVRVSKLSGQVIPKPARPQKPRNRHANRSVDTDPTTAMERTYSPVPVN